MKANELRIGNWVQRNQKQYRCISDTIVLFDNGQIELKPIPITEEWLLRFGFSLNEDSMGYRYFQLDSPYFKFDWMDNKIYFEVHYEYHYSLDCKYIHQLQNIYLTLTSQELTIKEAAR